LSMQTYPRPTSLDDFLREAITVLEAQGWRIVRQSTEEAVPWHIAGRKGEKWRLIQIVTPATSHTVTQSGRRLLGQHVQLPARLGTMEQWVAHIRPDGRCNFGPYTLNPQVWGSDNDVITRLELDAD